MLWHYSVAVFLTFLTLFLSLLLEPITRPNPFVLFFALIAFSVWYGGLGPALLVVVVSVFMIDYFLFVPPFVLFSSTNDLLRLIGFVLVAVLIITLSEARRRTAVSLRTQREWLQVTLTSIGDGVVTTDRYGKITFINPVAATLTGWQPSEVVGHDVQTVFQVLHSETRVPIPIPISDIVRDREIFNLPELALLMTRDGRELPIDDSIAPIKDGKGQIIGAILVFRDISLRRRAEIKLQAREQQQAALAALGQLALSDTSLDMLMDATVTLVAQHLSTTHCQVLELLADRQTLRLSASVGWDTGATGQIITTIHSNSQAAYTLRSNAAIMVDDLPTETRFSDEGLWSEYGIVSGMSVPIQGQEQPSGVLAVYSTTYRTFSADDVYFLQSVANVLAATIERRRTSAALAQSEQRYRHLANAMPLLVWVAQPDGMVDYFNESWYRYTGLTAEQSLGQAWQSVVHPDDAQRCQEQWQATLQLHQPYHLEYRLRQATGQYRWHLVRALPMYNAQGQLDSWISTATDIDEQYRAAETWRFLEAANATLVASVDYETRLQRIARLLVPRMADWCVVHLLENDGYILQVAWAEVDSNSDQAEVLHTLQQRAVKIEEIPAICAQVLQGGSALFIPDVLANERTVGAETPLLSGWFAQIQAQSVIVVPLTVRERMLGVITLMVVTAERRFQATDLALTQEFAQRTATALDNARLYQQSRVNVQRAEEALTLLDTLVTTAPVGVAFWDREFRFQRINQLLAEINGWSIEQHLGRTVREMVPNMADVAEQIFQRILDTGEPLLNQEISGETAALPGVERQWLESFYPVRMRSGEIIGIGVVAREITEEKRAEAERSQLLVSEQAARATAEAAVQRIARLQGVTAALAMALTPAQVAEVVVEQGIAAMGAYAGVIVLLSENSDMMYILDAKGYPPEILDTWQQIPLDAPVPLALVARTQEANWLENPEALATDFPELARLISPESRAWASLPLLVEQRTIGAIGFSFRTPQAFPPEDQAFALTLAQQCAQALDRARLYEAEQQARVQAEDAVYTRDVFLSIVSHELKTPLTSLLGYAHLLQQRATKIELPERDQRAIQVIADQSRRLHKLIELLLDISRIQTGHLRLERRLLSLNALVQRLVAEAYAESDHHVFELRCPDVPLMVECDEIRLEQVIQNLLQNAIKYSPDGGTITVQLARHETDVWLAVQDQGVGIPASDLPHLFQRFFRARNVSGAAFSGMGVGLYVVKEIVTHHGGSIQVDSTLGQGSTFTICLPLISPTATPPASAEPLPPDVADPLTA